MYRKSAFTRRFLALISSLMLIICLGTNTFAVGNQLHTARSARVSKDVFSLDPASGLETRQVDGSTFLTGILLRSDNKTLNQDILSAIRTADGCTASICDREGNEAPSEQGAVSGSRVWFMNGTRPAGELTIIVTGDVVGNGSISLTQLVRAAAIYTGTYTPQTWEMLAADQNGNGKVDITDLVREAQLYVYGSVPGSTPTAKPSPDATPSSAPEKTPKPEPTKASEKTPKPTARPEATPSNTDAPELTSRPQGTPRIEQLSDDEYQIVVHQMRELIHKVRRSHKLLELTAQPHLMWCAQIRAEEIASEMKLSGTRPDGSHWDTAGDAQGQWGILCELKETVAAFEEDTPKELAARIFEALQDKEGLDFEITTHDYDSIGIGVQLGADHELYGVLWLGGDLQDMQGSGGADDPVASPTPRPSASPTPRPSASASAPNEGTSEIPKDPETDATKPPASTPTPRPSHDGGLTDSEIDALDLSAVTTPSFSRDPSGLRRLLKRAAVLTDYTNDYGSRIIEYRDHYDEVTYKDYRIKVLLDGRAQLFEASGINKSLPADKPDQRELAAYAIFSDSQWRTGSGLTEEEAMELILPTNCAMTNESFCDMIFQDGAHLERDYYNDYGTRVLEYGIYGWMEDARLRIKIMKNGYMEVGEEVGESQLLPEDAPSKAEIAISEGRPDAPKPRVKRGPNAEYTLEQMQEDALYTVNELRWNKDVTPIKSLDLLNQAAQVRAEEMAANLLYDHTRPDGTEFDTVFKGVGNHAENIALREISKRFLPFWTVHGLSMSPGHYANMVNPSFQYMGSGFARGSDGLWYCCQLFSNNDDITWVDTPILPQ